LHNVHFLIDLTEGARNAVMEGRLAHFRREMTEQLTQGVEEGL
jgi:queuine/archaeosine tRNA-ribosyltransferase